VPFLVYSGHRHADESPDFAGVVWIEKPAPRSAIMEALAQLHPGVALRIAHAIVTPPSTTTI
jgi:hypothetical protein